MRMLLAACCMAGMMGPALAQEMNDTLMTPNQMMASCLKNAGLLDGLAAQEAGRKTCNDAFALAAGEMTRPVVPIGTDAMAPVGADSMAPAQ